MTVDFALSYPVMPAQAGIQNAGEKLNAVNSSQTIFKAAQLGYLGAAA